MSDMPDVIWTHEGQRVVSGNTHGRGGGWATPAFEGGIPYVPKPVWISVDDDRPEAGERVAVLRKNGTWDRGELHPLFFDGLPAWFLPEGPTEIGGTYRMRVQEMSNEQRD